MELKRFGLAQAKYHPFSYRTFIRPFFILAAGLPTCNWYKTRAFSFSEADVILEFSSTVSLAVTIGVEGLALLSFSWKVAGLLFKHFDRKMSDKD